MKVIFSLELYNLIFFAFLYVILHGQEITAPFQKKIVYFDYRSQ